MAHRDALNEARHLAGILEGAFGVELDIRIEPEIRSWERPAWEGEPVPEGWSYTSDKNPEVLSEADLIASFEEMEEGLVSV